MREDLKEELGFVAVYDAAFVAVRDIVDMPDKRASLFMRLCMQNGGKLSKAKRGEFKEISDAEIASMETAIQEVIAEHALLDGSDAATSSRSS